MESIANNTIPVKSKTKDSLIYTKLEDISILT